MQELDDYRFYHNIQKDKKVREFRDFKDVKDPKKEITNGHHAKKLHTEHGFVLRPTGHYVSASLSVKIIYHYEINLLIIA